MHDYASKQIKYGVANWSLDLLRCNNTLDYEKYFLFAL